jgi:methionyl-tRNA formyltransferase
MQNDAPLTIYRKIKALNPEPGAWTMNFPGREEVRVKLLDATYHDGVLTVTQIQPDGKKPMRV